MLIHVLILTSPVVLFFAQLGLISTGSRCRRKAGDGAPNAVVNSVVVTVLSLMGLVLAFSFSDAAHRLDANRKTILDEANAIEEVYHAIDMVKPETRERMIETFHLYVAARVRAYERYDEQLGRAEYDRQLLLSSGLYRDMWAHAIEGTFDSGSRLVLLNALNSASSTATARTLAMNTHMPPLIVGFLIGIVLVGALLVGTILAQSKGPSWLYRIAYAAVLSWTVFAIFDMEYPRLGAFQLLRNADALLVELKRTLR
jgi:hypothetical protein